MAYQPKHYLRVVYEFEDEASMRAFKKTLHEAEIAGELFLKDLSTYKE